jgi:hypothetical protein
MDRPTTRLFRRGARTTRSDIGECEFTRASVAVNAVRQSRIGAAQRVPLISGSVAAPQRTLYPMFTRTWSPWKRKLAVIV